MPIRQYMNVCSYEEKNSMECIDRYNIKTNSRMNDTFILYLFFRVIVINTAHVKISTNVMVRFAYIVSSGNRLLVSSPEHSTIGIVNRLKIFSVMQYVFKFVTGRIQITLIDNVSLFIQYQDGGKYSDS